MAYLAAWLSVAGRPGHKVLFPIIVLLLLIQFIAFKNLHKMLLSLNMSFKSSDNAQLGYSIIKTTVPKLDLASTHVRTYISAAVAGSELRRRFRYFLHARRGLHGRSFASTRGW